MKKSVKGLIVLFLILLIGTNISFAEKLNLPEASQNFYVYDEGNIWDADGTDYIVSVNENLYRKTGAQVVVAIVNTTGDTDIKEYANRLFEKWEIGSKEYDNGILILMDLENRELWIEVGYGLEGPLPDSKVGRIIEDEMIPSFKENQYEKGILNGFNSIITVIEDEYNVDVGRENVNQNIYENYSEKNFFGVGNILPKILIVIGVIVFLFIDFTFFHGCLTFFILRNIGRGGNGRGGGDRGGGGSSGGGGAGGRW